jgi:hypothetical protein
MVRASALSSRVRSSSRLPTLLAVVLVSVAVPCPASAATQASQLWAERYGSATLGDSPVLEASPDGSEVFVTAGSSGPTGGEDYATVAYDALTGTELWQARYNGTGNGYDYANALGVSSDGSRVFVTGQSDGSTGGEDYTTVAYEASTGTQLWTKRYNGTANLDDSAIAIGLSPDGSQVFVTGDSPGSTSDYDYATLAYDAATGGKLWAKRYDGPANLDDFVRSLGVSPDGSHVFVTGVSRGSTSGYDYATVAYDASTGTQLWAKRYDGQANLDDSATALGVSADGSQVFVTGDSARSSGDDDFATLAYEAATGDKLWAKRYNGPANLDDDATALGVSPDGSQMFVRSQPGIDEPRRLRHRGVRRLHRDRAVGEALRRSGERHRRGDGPRGEPRREHSVRYRIQRRIGRPRLRHRGL